MTTEHDHILRTYIRAVVRRSRRLLDTIRQRRRNIMRSHVKAALPAQRKPSAPFATLKSERKAPQQWRIGAVPPLEDWPAGADRAGGADRADHRSGNCQRAGGGPTAKHIARMQDTLDTLPPMTRAIFVAHCLDDLTFEMIAKRFGISVCDVVREFTLALVALDGVDSETGD